MSLEPTTNFKDSNGVDLGKKLISKDYLMSVYPSIAQEIGKTPELWTWGQNNYAQLGINDGVNKSTPVTTFAGGTNWKQVSVGGPINFLFAAGIKTDGTLWTWGNGGFGALGNASNTNRSTPVTTFAGGTNWKQVYCSVNHVVAIKTDGTLWLWGNGANGELGHNKATSSNTPVTTFAGGNNWRQASGPAASTGAIKTDGTLWVWGFNANGQLGINFGGFTSAAVKSTPVTTFAGGTNWKEVKGSYALKSDGSFWRWYSPPGVHSTPIIMFSGNNWKTISSRYAGIKTDGTLWVWGANDQGQLGTNDTIYRSTPVTTFAGGTNWKQVSIMFNFTTAIKTDGTLWSWGNNYYGQLGTNDATLRLTPVTTFAGGTNWKQVSSSYKFSAAIQSSDFI